MSLLPPIPVNSGVPQGLKYLEQLDPLLKGLHEVGCARDIAHNRKLHYDQYCMLLLLFLFNPAVKSLRSLQQTSELKNVQKTAWLSTHVPGVFLRIRRRL